MRLIYTLLIVFLFASCSKKDSVYSNAQTTSVEAIQVINATISPSHAYELSFSSPDVLIHKQASHFSVSAIGVDAKNGMTVYQYVAEKGFTGTDEVTLKETKSYVSYSEGGGCRNSSGMQSATKISYTKIKFSVAN